VPNARPSALRVGVRSPEPLDAETAHLPRPADRRALAAVPARRSRASYATRGRAAHDPHASCDTRPRRRSRTRPHARAPSLWPQLCNKWQCANMELRPHSAAARRAHMSRLASGTRGGQVAARQTLHLVARRCAKQQPATTTASRCGGVLARTQCWRRKATVHGDGFVVTPNGGGGVSGVGANHCLSIRARYASHSVLPSPPAGARESSNARTHDH
jgi:hypothetical protein